MAHLCLPYSILTTSLHLLAQTSVALVLAETAPRNHLSDLLLLFVFDRVLVRAEMKELDPSAGE